MKILIHKRTVVALISVLFILCSVVVSYVYSTYHVCRLTDEELRKHGIDGADKLMIVAHPDDEILWGGAHLMAGGYFVVVITNGNNCVRRKEFEKVIRESGNDGIILCYPDKAFFHKDSWNKNKSGIIKDVEKVMTYKDWKLIATHNPDGEYGHIHHKMTSSIVTDVYKDKIDRGNCKLYYFGKYYTKKTIGDHESEMTKITPEQLEYKERLEEFYRSQSRTIDMFEHMNCYEEWTCFEE